MAAGTVLSFCAVTGLHELTARQHPQPPQSNLAWVLEGMAIGGALGLVIPGLRRRRKPTPAPVWSSWREFVVSHKQRESEEITSFHLRPRDSDPLPAFRPGQFLTIELSIPGQTRSVLRTYSLSDYPSGSSTPDHYRLSIKREPPPPGLEVPAGLASNHLHDHVEVGSCLKVRPPAGNFVLDTGATTPIVLISNGVGITPMIAMAKAALQQPGQRQVLFVHGCRNGRFHAFAGEIDALAQHHGNLQPHIVYSRPLDSDQGHFQSEGRVDGALIQRLVQGPADYFLCGSPPFMDNLISQLKQSGVDEAAIHFESFSRAPGANPPAPQADGAASSETATVSFAQTGTTATWTGEDPEQSLLSLAEAEGLQPPFACRAGVCGTCATRLLKGEVVYPSEPSAPRQEGEVLLCIARPGSRTLTLDL